MIFISCSWIGTLSPRQARPLRFSSIRWSTGCGSEVCFSWLVASSRPGRKKTRNAPLYAQKHVSSSKPVRQISKVGCKQVSKEEMMGSSRITFYVLLLTLVLAGLWTDPASAQGPTPTDDEVNRIAKQLYCPVCESTPLDVCPTEACRQWRDLTRQQLPEGWTEDQIKQYFVENYGARVLAEPPRQGLNWLVYLLPPAIILAGAVILFRLLREWTKPKAASANLSGAGGEASTSKDEYVARLEEELK